MKKNVIVSLADSNYFELLNELIDSIKSFGKSKDIAICILDAGLTEDQRSILSKKVDEIKSAEWDIEVPAFFILISFLLISKIPTFAFKKIAVPRRMTIFALFSIVLFFGLLLIYTFKVLVICGMIYICLIPIGYFNYKRIYKQKILSGENDDNDELEDIL